MSEVFGPTTLLSLPSHVPSTRKNRQAGTRGRRKATHSNYKQAPGLQQWGGARSNYKHGQWQQQQQTRKQRKALMKGEQSKQLSGKPRAPIPSASDACMRALGLVSVSGFVRVSKGLQKTCVELSNVAREGAAWKVKVNTANQLPVRLQRFWPRSEEQQRALLQLPPSRLIQRKLVTSVSILPNCSIGQDFMWPSAVEKIRFGVVFNKDLGEISWPSTVQEIELSHNFSQPIEKVAWPKNLQVLTLGDKFNCPVEAMVFPHGMHRIEFSRMFDQPIAGVKWPSRLRVLKLGEDFNRRVTILVVMY